MFQEIARVDAVVAAGMVGIASIGNAVGRIFWAWVSDTISRRWTFVTMFLLQIGLFWVLPSISTGGNSYSPVVHRPDVLWRGIRHYAGLYRRLLRIEECRSHLRPDADSMGSCERFRAVADRQSAPVFGSLRLGASHRRGDHGCLADRTNRREAAQGARLNLGGNTLACGIIVGDGELAERFKAPVLKTVVPERVP